MANKYISDDELRKAEHECLSRLVLVGGTNDYVLGGVIGILQFVNELTNGAVAD